jgi:hypothetical protein
VSIDSIVFARYAKAEREFCEKAGAILTTVMEDIEVKHGIAVAEVRVTMDRVGSNGWARANCVLVREVESNLEQDAGDRSLIGPVEPPAAERGSATRTYTLDA